MMVNEHDAVVYAAIIAGAGSIINLGITIATNRYFRKKDYDTEQRGWITDALTGFYLPLARHLNKIKICLQNYQTSGESLTLDSLIEELAEIKESVGRGIKATHDVKLCVNEFVQFISKENFVYINHNLFYNYGLIDRFIFTLNMAIKEKIVSYHYDFNVNIIDCFIKGIDNVSNSLTIHPHKKQINDNPNRRKK